MREFNVVHDLLDAQLVDRQREKMGRADEVLLDLREGSPPRIAAILVGSAPRAERVGRLWAAAGRLLRRLVHLPAPVVTRIPFTAVRVHAERIEVDVNGIDTPAMRGERTLRRIIRHIPGAESGLAGPD